VKKRQKSDVLSDSQSGWGLLLPRRMRHPPDSATFSSAVAPWRRMDGCLENRTQMTQKTQLFADEKQNQDDLRRAVCIRCFCVLRWQGDAARAVSKYITLQRLV